MATMVTSTRPVTKKGAGQWSRTSGTKRKRLEATATSFAIPTRQANRYRIGMWVGLASIAMMFTALSSAYIVRSAYGERLVPAANAAGAVCEHRVDSDQQRHDRSCATKTEAASSRKLTRSGCC